jgi:hypothetical protein
MASPLTLLEDADFDLAHNNPVQEVNQALAACSSALDCWAHGLALPRKMTVYPRATAYDSVNQRNQLFDLYLDRNPLLQGTFTNAEWEEEKQAYGIIGDAVVTATQRNSVFYMVSMQNPVFSHSWHQRHWGQDTPELRQAFYDHDREWHEFVIVLNSRKVSD